MSFNAHLHGGGPAERASRFPSESVHKDYPGKLCDQASDAVPDADARLTEDFKSRRVESARSASSSSASLDIDDFDDANDIYGFLRRDEEQGLSQVADAEPVVLPIEQLPAPISFAQLCAEDNARKRRRQTEAASCPFRSIVCSLPGRHVGLPPSCSSLLQSAVAEEAANPASHVGLRGVFEGLLTNVYQAGSTCDLIVRGASAFYIGATVRTLRVRWGDPDHGHFRRWDRMYGLCRCSDAISLANCERMMISRYQDTSRWGSRCVNRGGGGERLPTVSSPGLYIGWLYVCVRDRAAGESGESRGDGQ